VKRYLHYPLLCQICYLRRINPYPHLPPSSHRPFNYQNHLALLPFVHLPQYPHLVRIKSWRINRFLSSLHHLHIRLHRLGLHPHAHHRVIPLLF